MNREISAAEWALIAQILAIAVLVGPNEKDLTLAQMVVNH